MPMGTGAGGARTAAGPRREDGSLHLSLKMLQAGLEERDALPLMGMRCQERGRAASITAVTNASPPGRSPRGKANFSLRRQQQCGE